MFFWLKIAWFALIFSKIAQIGVIANLSWGILLVPLFAYILARLTPAILAFYLMARTLRVAKAQMDAMQPPPFGSGSSTHDNKSNEGRTINGESRHIDIP